MSPGPFERHLRDAIALNRERAPRYAELSGGASRAISRALIAAELVLLPVARWFDRRAEPYHRAGIPLLEELFVPMADAPAFGAPLGGPLGGPLGAPSAAAPASGARRPRVREIRARVRVARRERGFAGAADALDDALAGLSAWPATECLVRHLLESARRLARLAPGHIEMSRDRGLASPESLLTLLFRLHLAGLGGAAMLDARARPLQASGIPVLANDLPRIPEWP